MSLSIHLIDIKNLFIHCKISIIIYDGFTNDFDIYDVFDFDVFDFCAYFRD